MSVQFGRWNYDGRPVEPDYRRRVQSAIESWAPDEGGDYCEGGVGISYRAFHTTAESHREVQPRTLPSGSVLTFDGRLDNRPELLRDFRLGPDDDASDVDIVAALYERRNTGSFSMLIGDWALTVWNPSDRSLILARDPIGIRPLHFSVDQERVTWCTRLEPLVSLAGARFALEEEYIAGWLSLYPADHLTPYVGISSVPPSSFVRIRPGESATARYWDFNPDKKIRLESDCDYEEQFRAVFQQSVRRRLRADAPVLAELSGGMDSSSIVCVADSILSKEPAGSEKLHTVSYYDDSEPAWDERPYFAIVERQLGRTGCHIDAGSLLTSGFVRTNGCPHAAPGSSGAAAEVAKQLHSHMNSCGCRIILSGIGGDEFTGGVPKPTPELADLLVQGRFGKLTLQCAAWAVAKRRPFIHLLWETLRGFAPAALAPVPKQGKPPAWFQTAFVNRHAKAFAGYEPRLKFFGPLPSFQENLSTLNQIRRQIGCLTSSPELLPREMRYPYLDRDLLEFLFAVPREQLVRPGARRSLMRRALAGIVPDAVLHRRRKAFVARSPRVAISRRREWFQKMSREMILDSLGIVDGRAFSEAIAKAALGLDVPIVPLLRTIDMELWLEDLREQAGPKHQAAPAASEAPASRRDHTGRVRETRNDLS